MTSPSHLLPRLIDQHRDQLIEPLKNVFSKSPNSKNRIENGAKTAIDTDEGPHLLQQGLIDETLIISDLYNLDEIKTLELLWSAENFQPQNPGLTRGLGRDFYNQIRAMFRFFEIETPGVITELQHRSPFIFQT